VVILYSSPTRRAKKVNPLQNFANFSIIIDRYDKKIYILVTHSIICKSGKFHYITYRNDKITLLLVMATYQNYLSYSRQCKQKP